jgi:broad specificity phosphatase PhoE
MLAESNVLLIRHAEKPLRGKGLSPMGEARAEGYAAYFPNLPLARPSYSHLFASTDSSKSERPVLTLTPLAKRLNMIIATPYPDAKYKCLATELLGPTDYTSQNIVICWHHGEILGLAKHLLKGYKPPKEADWPEPPWPPEVFGWLLWIVYDKDENPTSDTRCWR